MDVFSLGVPLVKLKRNEKVPVGSGHYENPTVLTKEACQGSNVGVICGHGIVVVDIDRHPGQADGFATLANLQVAFGELPETLSVSTPNQGRHLYFRSSQPLPNVKLPGIDLKAQRCYVAAPPSSLPNGPYEWTDPEVEIAELPEWLHDFWLGGGLKTQAKVPVEPSVLYSDDEVREMLSRLDPEQGREFWIHVGMGLHERDQDSLYLWDAWSKPGKTYPGFADVSYQWASFKAEGTGKRTFGTVVYFARMAGWEPKIELPKSPAFSVHLPALWHELYEMMLACSFVPLPQFAFASTAALLSSSFQGYWLTPDGGSLSLYQLIAAPPGGGKDRPREFLQSAIQELRPERLLGGFASPQGLFLSLMSESNRIAVIDEIGHWLSRCVSTRECDGIQAQVRDMLLTLVNHVHELVPEASKGNTKKPDPVKTPKLSLFGTITLHQLKELLHGSAFITSGLFSRMHFWTETERRPSGTASPIDKVEIRRLVARIVNAVNSTAFKQLETDPVKIPDDIIPIECGLDEERQTRRFFRVRRWASLHSLASGRKRVTQTDIDWGFDIERQESLMLSRTARDSMESRQLERALESVKMFVAKCGIVDELDLLRGVPQLNDLSARMFQAVLKRLGAENKLR